MSGNVRPIPEGYHAVTSYLFIRGAAAAIDFYRRAFGAVELFRLQSPDGTIGHAEIKIGDSPVMLAEEMPGMNVRGPQSLGGTSVGLMIYLENVDEVFQRAVECGATVVRPLQNQFYGDRSGTVLDPFGHQWTVATHVEDVPPAEMERRAAEFMSQSGGGA